MFLDALMAAVFLAAIVVPAACGFDGRSMIISHLLIAAFTAILLVRTVTLKR